MVPLRRHRRILRVDVNAASQCSHSLKRARNSRNPVSAQESEQELLARRESASKRWTIGRSLLETDKTGFVNHMQSFFFLEFRAMNAQIAIRLYVHARS